MNDKMFLEIKQLVSKFINLEFDEDIIKLLLINLRDNFQYDSVLKEISHFIAHPERTQGLFHKKIASRYYRIEKINQEMMNLVIPEDATGSFDDLIWENRNDDEIHKIPKRLFELVILNGVDDFTEDFILKISGLSREKLKNQILRKYKKSHGYYLLKEKDLAFTRIIWFLKTSTQFIEVFSIDKLFDEFLHEIKDYSENCNQFIAGILTEQHKRDFIIIILSLLNEISYYENKELVGKAFFSVKNRMAILACKFFPLKKEITFPLLLSNIEISKYCNHDLKDFEVIGSYKAIRNDEGKLELINIDI